LNVETRQTFFIKIQELKMTFDKKTNVNRQITAYIFILPAFIIIGVFIIYPSLRLFVSSFSSVNIMGFKSTFIGLQNYIDLFQSTDFWSSFKSSFYFMIIVMPVQTAIALFMAVQVNKKVKGIGIFRTIYFIPVVTSFVVVGFLWRYLYNKDFGLFNNFLEIIGIARQGFLGDPGQAMHSIIVASIWKSWAFFMIMYLAGLKDISKELYEAAGIDGCNGWQKFIYITFPQLKRVTLFIVIITTMDCMTKVFTPVFIMTQGGPRNTTDMVVYYIWRQAFRLGEIGFASAAAVIMFLIVLIISILQFKLSDRKKLEGE
jgi:multiple sugar transport system permease protein